MSDDLESISKTQVKIYEDEIERYKVCFRSELTVPFVSTYRIAENHSGHASAIRQRAALHA